MNHYWHQVSAVTVWEFKRFFKWKQELMTYGLMFVIFIGISLWQGHIADNDTSIKLAVSDEITLPAHDRFKVSYFPANELTTIQQSIGDKLDAAVYRQDDNIIIFVAEKNKWLESFKGWMSKIAQSEKLSQAGISGEELQLIITPYQYKLQVKGETTASDGKSQTALFTMILLMVGVFTAFAYAFASITTEKQQRVTEQLLSTMSAQTWIDGKIFGITLLCFKSLLTTALSMFIFYRVMALIDGTATSTSTIELSFILPLVAFVILGLLMWNSLLAGFAATIDDPNHSSRTVLMLVPAVPIFLAYSLADAPQSITMQVLSYFPLTSFAAMPIRMAEATIPFWQQMISISILLVSIYFFRKAAARLFNMGVMMYGKEPNMKEMFNALMNKHT